MDIPLQELLEDTLAICKVNFGEFRFNQLKLVEQPNIFVEAFKVKFNFTTSQIEEQLQQINALRADYRSGKKSMDYLGALMCESNVWATIQGPDMRFKLANAPPKLKLASSMNEIVNIFTHKAKEETMSLTGEIKMAMINNAIAILSNVVEGILTEETAENNEQAASSLLLSYNLICLANDQAVESEVLNEKKFLEALEFIKAFIALTYTFCSNLTVISCVEECPVELLDELEAKMWSVRQIQKSWKPKDKAFKRKLNNLKHDFQMMLHLKKFNQSEKSRNHVKNYVGSHRQMKMKYGSQLSIEISRMKREDQSSIHDQSDTTSSDTDTQEIMGYLKLEELADASKDCMQEYLEKNYTSPIDTSVFLSADDYKVYTDTLSKISTECLGIDTLVGSETMLLVQEAIEIKIGSGKEKTDAQMQKIFEDMCEHRGFKRHFKKEEEAGYRECKRLLSQLKILKQINPDFKIPRGLDPLFVNLESIERHLEKLHGSMSVKATKYLGIDAQLEAINPKTFEDFKKLMLMDVSNCDRPNFEYLKENLLAVYNDCVDADDNVWNKIQERLYLSLAQNRPEFEQSEVIAENEQKISKVSEQLKGALLEAAKDFKESLFERSFLSKIATGKAAPLATTKQIWYSLFSKRLQMIQEKDYTNCIESYRKMSKLFSAIIHHTTKELIEEQQKEFLSIVALEGLDQPIKYGSYVQTNQDRGSIDPKILEQVANVSESDINLSDNASIAQNGVKEEGN